MSSFNNPNFKRTFQSTAQKPMKEFTVGSPEDLPEEFREPSPEELAQIEAAARLARQQKTTQHTQITEPAKKRVELLANIGRLTKDVEVGGYTFSLRTLKSRETREASLEPLKMATSFELGHEARRQQLARSIFKIDGQDLEYVLGDDVLETRLSFIDELEDSVVSKLFDELAALKNEATKQFAVKTEEDGKEVAQDLKK